MRQVENLINAMDGDKKECRFNVSYFYSHIKGNILFTYRIPDVCNVCRGIMREKLEEKGIAVKCIKCIRYKLLSLLYFFYFYIHLLTTCP